MEVFVSSPTFRFSNVLFPDGSVVRDVLTRVVQEQGVSSNDFYVITNGRLSALEDPLQHGALYHLEPRLCGGKGGFGSMLRALGAQIEKTTNREACRDLSGRRLRDVNHEKEMAEWLKKQAEREAEKEQRRLERLQRKLAEPKHQFTDPGFQQQCHDLSERLEDSVLKGLQASSSGQVKVDDVLAVKRPNSDQSQEPEKKKQMTAATASACVWTGLDELLSSEDEEDYPSTSSFRCGATDVTMTTQTQEESPTSSRCGATAVTMTTQTQEESPCSSKCGATAVTMTTQTQAESPSSSSCAPALTVTAQREEAEPEQISSSSPALDQTSSSTQHTCKSSETYTDQGPTETGTNGGLAETSTDQMVRLSEESSRSSQQQQQQGRPPLDLSSVSSVQQLESLGLDVLKEELMSRGLKCGGTLLERAARLFSVRGLNPDQINPALLAKPGKTRRK